MVGDYINIVKTTIDFNFDLYKALKQHAIHKHGRENLSIENASIQLLVNL